MIHTKYLSHRGTVIMEEDNDVEDTLRYRYMPPGYHDYKVSTSLAEVARDIDHCTIIYNDKRIAELYKEIERLTKYNEYIKNDKTP